MLKNPIITVNGNCGSIVYADGTLEDFLGTDLLACENFQEGVFVTNIENKKCIAFLWIVKDQKKGLIVDINDKESIEYACEQFTNKSLVI